MSKDKEPEPVHVPIICPSCKGIGRKPYHGYEITSVLCLRCHGMGNIGYTERTQVEIDAAGMECEG